MKEYIDELDLVGGFWSIENPGSSYIWHTDEIKELALRHDVLEVRFTQCTYVLRPPDFAGTQDLRVRKDTTILTNVPTLVRLCRSCTLDHTHVHLLGSVRVAGRTVSLSTRFMSPLGCRRRRTLVRR